MTTLATASTDDNAGAAYMQDIPAEQPWSRILKRGQTLRIVDSEGQQAVDALHYCADDPAERYSAQDTLRVQGSAYIDLGTGVVSNKGQGTARDGGDYGRFLWKARYVGGLLLLRNQCRPVLGIDQVSARLPRKFHHGTVEA